MKRAMSVWFPSFAIDAWRRRRRSSRSDNSAAPLLLTVEDHQRQVVHACCDVAQRAGVVPGMPVAEAGGLLSAPPEIQPHAPAHDRAMLERLAIWASRRFSPTVALDDPDGLMLDISGCAQMFGGERRLIRQVQAACHGLGFQPRLAIAPTFGAAWGIARFADPPNRIVEQPDLVAALRPMPVRALGVSPEIQESLQRLGIDTLEHLAALPRTTIPARFGAELLLSLDQAMGHAMETLHPVRPHQPPTAERVFDGPTTCWEALEITLKSLLASVCTQLHAREAGARGLRVSLDRSDCPPTGFSLRLSQPTRDDAHLWALARPHLERAHLGFGVETIRVKALHLTRLPHDQRERWREGQSGGDAGNARARSRLIDALTNRLGAHHVRRFEPAASHMPERAGRLMAAVDPKLAQTSRLTPADRPTQLFETPEPVSVIALTPDGPVMRLTWRGEDLDIISCIGPERLGPEWWADDVSGRDYFKAQDQHGRWLWLRRDTAGNRWTIHGVWA